MKEKIHFEKQGVLSKRLAIRFVILMGFISLFADITYEGARSLSGPFLAVLGASPFCVR